VVVGQGPVLLKRVVYIQLWNKDVLQHVEVHMTSNFSLGNEGWVVNLYSAYGTENNLGIALVWIL